jgi:serine/threonine-protein kinase
MTPSQHIAGYRILAKMGQGAASELYAVQDPKTKQVYALKHVVKRSERDQRFLEQVEREYEVGCKLDHPSIRGVSKLIRHRRMFKVRAMDLLMELVDGIALDKQPPKDHTQAVRIFHQAAEGLAHMHGRGFVHADIKPHNLMVDDHDRLKIIDLGQACVVGTVKKRIQGTPGYMAPEQAHRQAITAKTDIYNLGATMYSILVGELIPTAMPPRDETSNSLFSGALDADQVDPPVPPIEKDASIHPLLSRQILDCVQIRPDDRPESMAFVANRLELIADLLENPPRDSSLVADEDTRG